MSSFALIEKVHCSYNETFCRGQNRQPRSKSCTALVKEKLIALAYIVGRGWGWEKSFYTWAGFCVVQMSMLLSRKGVSEFLYCLVRCGTKGKKLSMRPEGYQQSNVKNKVKHLLY